MFKNKYISLYKNGSRKPLLGHEPSEVTVAQGVGGSVKQEQKRGVSLVAAPANLKLKLPGAAAL